MLHWHALLPFLTLGLLGAAHCAGMCGGFAVSVSLASGPGKLRALRRQLVYVTGKALPKRETDRKRRKVVAAAHRPGHHRTFRAYARTAIDAAEWLRTTDEAITGAVLKLASEMERDPKLTPRLMPLYLQACTMLGLSPEARIRLAMELVDCEPERPVEDFSRPSPLRKAG